MTIQVEVVERDGEFWVELTGRPQRLTGINHGPYDSRRDAMDARQLEDVAQNTGGFAD